jgi:hypothetical protein
LTIIRNRIKMIKDMTIIFVFHAHLYFQSFLNMVPMQFLIIYIKCFWFSYFFEALVICSLYTTGKGKIYINSLPRTLYLKLADYMFDNKGRRLSFHFKLRPVRGMEGSRWATSIEGEVGASNSQQTIRQINFKFGVKHNLTVV